MTKTEAIAEIKQAMKDADEQKLWFDARGDRETGWRMYTYSNGLYRALEVVEQIDSLK